MKDLRTRKCEIKDQMKERASDFSRDSSKAFSLLEVLVALAITGLCLGLVATSFGAVFRAHRRARENVELQQVSNETMARIRMLLQAAYLSPHYPNHLMDNFEAMDLDNLSKPYDAITFSTLAHTSHKINAKEADLAEVTLFTEDEPAIETPEGNLRFQRLRVRVGGVINDRFEVEGGVVYTLADHVTQFLLEYLDDEGEWRSEWMPGDHGNNLPCAVRITLGVRTETIEERTSEIMVPLEMSKLRCRFEDERVFEQ